MLILVYDEAPHSGAAASYVAGRPVVDHVIAACRLAGCRQIYGWSSHPKVRARLDKGGVPLRRTERNCDAVAKQLMLDMNADCVLIVSANCPFLGDSTILDAWNRLTNSNFDITSCFEAPHPLAWLRVMDETGVPHPLVEACTIVGNRQEEALTWVTCNTLRGKRLSPSRNDWALTLPALKCLSVKDERTAALAQYHFEQGSLAMPEFAPSPPLPSQTGPKQGLS